MTPPRPPPEGRPPMPLDATPAPAAEPGPRGLILDFAGVLTADPRDAQHAWCRSEGLAPGAWRAALVEHPEGRRLYAALETGKLAQAEWNTATAALLGPHVDPVNLMGRAWAEVAPARRMIALARAPACRRPPPRPALEQLRPRPVQPVRARRRLGSLRRARRLRAGRPGQARSGDLSARPGQARAPAGAVRLRRRPGGQPRARGGDGIATLHVTDEAAAVAELARHLALADLTPPPRPPKDQAPPAAAAPSPASGRDTPA